MNMQKMIVPVNGASPKLMNNYFEMLAVVERMHRLLLDVIKDDFERLGLIDINSVQALLLFNIGNNEVTAGELKTRGYYQGSNVSYNLKKLVEYGYMVQEKCAVDRRSIRVKLSPKGKDVSQILKDLFTGHAEGMEKRNIFSNESLYETANTLKNIEHYLGRQIRYIY